MSSKARIDLEARDNATQVFNRVQQSMGDLDKRAGALSTGFSGITRAFGATSLAGAGFGAALAAAVTRTAEFEDAIGKAAQRAGVTADQFSRLAYAAGLSDVSLQELQKGLQLLGVDAANGGRKLAELQIEVQNLDGSLKSNDQLLREVADRISRMATPAERSAAAVRLLGEEGAKLVPLLMSGSDGLVRMGAEAERFGRVVSDDAAAAAAEFNDNIARLKESAAGLTRQLAGPLVAALADVTSRFLSARSEGQGFWRAMERVLQPTTGSGTRNSIQDAARDVRLLEREIQILEATAGLGGPDRNRLFLLNKQLNDARSNLEQLQALQAQASQNVFTPAATTQTPARSSARASSAAPRISEAQRYLQSLQSQLEAMDELTAAEMLLRDISMGRLGTVTAAQRAELLAIAQSIDARREMAQQEAEAEAERQAFIQARRQDAIDELESIHARNDAHQRFIETLLSNTPTERLEEQRRVMQLLADEFERGAISAEQFSEAAQTYLGTLGGEIERTRSLTDDLGLTFTSAFEDAIAGGKGLSDVLKGVEADILRLVTRRLVTEPLGNFLTGALGRMIPSFDGGGFTGSGSRSGGLDGRGGYLAMLHPNETVLDHTKSQRMGGSVQNINITVPMPSNGRRETAMQFGRDVARQLQMASMRNG